MTLSDWKLPKNAGKFRQLEKQVLSLDTPNRPGERLSEE